MTSRIRGFLATLAIVAALGLAGSSPARADHGPVLHHDPYGGTYIGWGWYPIVTGVWPWTPYGYSYYAWHGYLPRYASFGAIAWSRATGKVGVAWGKPTLAMAAAASQGFCGAPDCQAVVWVQGGCAAIARGVNQTSVSFGYHLTQGGARDYALHSCRVAGGVHCRLGAWVCSY